jgi:signal peptidase I
MTPKLKSLLKSLRNGVMTLMVPLLIAIILRVFFIEIYKIPSSSMEPTLQPGDIILVSKMSYGARVLKPVKFFKQNKIEYVRMKGWSKVKKGDVFVFNIPRYNKYLDSTLTIYGACLVKRCYGMPGDTILIKNEGIKESRIRNEEMRSDQPDDRLFPRDTTLNWSLNNYGPLYVPARGKQMDMTKRNVTWYKKFIRYESQYNQVNDSVLLVSGEPVFQYTFQHDYYFMLGDNFYNSNDSRYWGFVPDDNIIGKAVMILFSIDPDENGIKKFCWSRFLKKIP